jgi:hypothetical protein
MITDVLEYQATKLNLNECNYARLIKREFANEPKYSQHKDYMTGEIIANFQCYFLSRELKEAYCYSHPKNLWHLLLFFIFGRWDWFRYKFIKFNRYTITLKEAYTNITIPEKEPFVIINKYKNGSEVATWEEK